MEDLYSSPGGLQLLYVSNILRVLEKGFFLISKLAEFDLTADIIFQRMSAKR